MLKGWNVHNHSRVDQNDDDEDDDNDDDDNNSDDGEVNITSKGIIKMCVCGGLNGNRPLRLIGSETEYRDVALLKEVCY